MQQAVSARRRAPALGATDDRDQHQSAETEPQARHRPQEKPSTHWSKIILARGSERALPSISSTRDIPSYSLLRIAALTYDGRYEWLQHLAL